jgi:adenylosuccinate lyase
MMFSERILLELVKKGLTREQAYQLVQRNAMKVWENGVDFRDALLSDTDLLSHISAKEIDSCFDLGHHLRFVDEIFQRAGITNG